VDAHTTHSFSTSVTSATTGDERSHHDRRSDRVSSRSTTTITSIPSSPRHQEEETRPEPEIGSANSLLARARALQKEFELLFQHRNPNDVVADARCEQYHESRKETNTKRMGNAKSKHLADIIIAKIEETGVNSSQEWENIVSPEFKLQLIKEFGLTVDTYIQKIIRIVKVEKVTKIKCRTLTELYIDLLNTTRIPDDDESSMREFMAIVPWIQYLFMVNDIDLIDFMAWNEIIKTQRYMKINGMVLEGYTNVGKSLIVDNLIGICKPEEIPRERDNSGFHLYQLPAASCALFEEPLITPTNIGTWKLLLEGKVVKTDIKHKDKEEIKRMPIWITTATPITTHVDVNESIQLRQRVKVWHLKKCIQHRADIHTLDSELTRRLIRKAPGFVRPVHFAFLWLSHFRAIFARIQDLDKDHIKNIDVSDSVVELARAWQTRLRQDFWNPRRRDVRETIEDQTKEEEEECRWEET